MKQTILAFAVAVISTTTVFSQNLKDVTIGFAAGPAYTFSNAYDYSLSPDAMQALKVQKLSKGAFVVSSMLTVKFKKLKVDTSEQKRFRIQEPNNREATFRDRLCLDVALNVLEIKNDVKFNTSIDGGLGIGYFIHENTHVALMFDISTIRQMRPYIVALYEDKPIPKGNEFYNALDVGDNSLFYNKTITGVSLKVVFSL